MSHRLIISATRMEAEPLLNTLDRSVRCELPLGEGVRGVRAGLELTVAWFGVGKVNTAAGLALAIDRFVPPMVVQLGIGGSFASSGLELGEAVVASEEIHLDLGVASPDGLIELGALGFPLLPGDPPVFNSLSLDPQFAAQLAGPFTPRLPFGTAETVTGWTQAATTLEERFGIAVESMEGAAAAQVCRALRVPFGEIRGVSNAVGERDKQHWRIDEALSSAHTVLNQWLERGGKARP